MLEMETLTKNDRVKRKKESPGKHGALGESMGRNGRLLKLLDRWRITGKSR